jgi:hypothetical protein
VAFILTAGSLTALNKLSEDDQNIRLSKGLQRKLRPVNNSSTILKGPLRLASKSDAGVRARKRLEPIQLGLGSKSGPEKMAFIARAAYGLGNLIGTKDAADGFQRVNRQSMLDRMHTSWPEAVAHFNLYYGAKSIVIYKWHDEEGVLHVKLIWSEEGTRMGDLFGSIGFDIVADIIYVELAKLYPDFHSRALTDDLPVFIPPPLDYQAFYLKYAGYLSTFDKLAAPHGIVLNHEKSKLLIPVDAPDPDDMSIFPDGFIITREGLEIAGAAIGTDDYVRTSANKAVGKFESKFDSLTPLSIAKPRMTMQIITSCLNRGLNYLARVTPPLLWSDAIDRFDTMVSTARDSILAPHLDAPPACSKQRYDRADFILKLFLHQTPMSMIAPAAFLAGMVASMPETMVSENLDTFARFTSDIHTRILSHLRLAAPIDDSTLPKVLPADPTRMTDGSFYPHFIETNPKCKIQRTITNAIATCNLKAFRVSIHPDQIDAANGLSDSDVIHAETITSKRSWAAFPSNAPISETHKNLFGLRWITWWRSFSTLPPLLRLGNATKSPHFDYVTDLCHDAHSENREIDALGDHACSKCASAKSGICAGHRMLGAAIKDSAIEAGTTVTMEPATKALLLDEFSDEECHRIAPKTLSKIRSAPLLEAIDRLKNASPAEAPALGAAIMQEIAALPPGKKGLRIDIDIVDPDTGASLWIDTAQVHPSCKNYRKKSLAAARRILDWERTGQAAGLPRPAECTRGDSVTSVENKKKVKYLPLIAIAEKQLSQGLRYSRPDFKGFIVSHSLEPSQDVVSTLEWLTTAFIKDFERKPDRLDGLGLRECLIDFRRKFKARVAFASASGFGRACLAAGYPHRRRAY